MKRLMLDLRGTLARFREHEASRIAAAIAFYVLFSAAPAVALLVVSVGWVIRDPHEQARVTRHMVELLPTGSTQNHDFLVNSIRVIQKASAGISLAGLLGLAWSGLGMFSAARWGLNRAWGVRGRRGVIGVHFIDLGVAAGIWLLLLASAACSVAIRILTHENAFWLGGPVLARGVAWTISRWILPAILSFLAFLFLYRYVPDVKHTLKDVLPAALVATIFFELSKYLYALYVDVMASHSSLYSALGGVLGFMLWVYLCSVILLLGAEYASATQRRRNPASRKEVAEAKKTA